MTWLIVLSALALVFAAYITVRERSLGARSVSMADDVARLTEELKLQTAEVARLKDLQHSRADVVASVTHQLKTPLTSLLGYVHILRTRNASLDGEQREEFLDVVADQGEKIVRLIEELLQSTRAEEGLSALQRVPLDLAGIARRVAREMGPGRNRHIVLDAPKEDLGLYGDPVAMEHIITNLIDNAIKYSPDETPVFVAIEDGAGEVLLTVRDEGRGIAADELPFIFERFRQASNARGAGSVGLGLHIVKSFVEAHKGRVWVESDPGKGATFFVALPRRRR